MSELNAQGNKLLHLLADGKFHSGEKIGEILGVSRTTVSNYIKALQEIGLDIYKISGKGYCSACAFKFLDKDRIKKLSKSENVHVEQVIDSTNQWLLERIPNLEQGQACLAEYQSKGRGRRGRSWVSPFGSHLYFSFYWRFDSGIDKLSGLSLLIGIATVNALSNIGVTGASLKWPNDIYHEGQKLAGILIELNAQATEACHCVIGIGLNISMPKTQGELIDQPWTDLEKITGLLIDRNLLSAALITELNKLLPEYEEFGFEKFLPNWNSLDCFVGKKVNLNVIDKNISGICKGVDKNGAILIDIEGEVKSFIGGEVSLRAAI